MAMLNYQRVSTIQRFTEILSPKLVDHVWPPLSTTSTVFFQGRNFYVSSGSIISCWYSGLIVGLDFKSWFQHLCSKTNFMFNHLCFDSVLHVFANINSNFHLILQLDPRYPDLRKVGGSHGRTQLLPGVGMKQMKQMKQVNIIHQKWMDED